MLVHNKQKLKAIADECFTVMPDWDELMQFVQLAAPILQKDADEWYEKTLWDKLK